MATIADYQVLIAGSEVLDHRTIRRSVELEWPPPPDFVPGTGKERPVLTWQFWPFETSEYSVFLWPDNAPPFNPHERGGVPPDQLHTGSMTLHGPDLTVPGKIVFTAGVPARFWLELVTIWYQRHIK